MIRNPKLQVLIAVLLGLIAAVLVWDYSRKMQAEVQAAKEQALQPPVVEQADVLVAVQDIPPRHKVTSDLFKVIQVPKEDKLPQALSRVDDVNGLYTLYPLVAGEQVVPMRLATQKTYDSFAQEIPPGKRAIAITISPLIGAGGLIQPGNYVDILVSYDKGVIGENMVSTLMQNVEVLAVAESYAAQDSPDPAPPLIAPATGVAGTPVAAATPIPTATSAPKQPLQHADARTVTLAVSPEQGEQLLLAEDHGHLRLSLRGAGDTEVTNVQTVVLTAVPTAELNLGVQNAIPTSTPAPSMTSTPVPTPKSPVQVTDVQIGPSSLRPGDVLRAEITVKNVSDKPIKSQGPDPQFTYVQGQTYGTQQFPSVPGSFRVGLNIDGNPSVPYPYRWGLGGDLAPGASTTVVCLVKVTYDTKPTTFSAGVIHEPADIVVDNAGPTLVTIAAAKSAVITVNNVHVRSGPDINSSVVATLPYGVQVAILGQQDDWYKVRMTNGKEGYVAAGWIVAVPDGSPPVANGAPSPPRASLATNDVTKVLFVAPSPSPLAVAH